LALELQQIQESDYDLSLTGFDPDEIDGLLALEDDEKANAAPPPDTPVSRLGDLWLLGDHRVGSGDATSAEVVARLLGERKSRLLVRDPPYGIELNSEWRDRAGLNGSGPAEPSCLKKRTKGQSRPPSPATRETTGARRSSWPRASRPFMSAPHDQPPARPGEQPFGSGRTVLDDQSGASLMKLDAVMTDSCGLVPDPPEWLD
jgi:hypothetical protein